MNSEIIAEGGVVMQSPEGLEYDVVITELTKEEQSVFMGEILEVCGDDVVVNFKGKRVLVNRNDVEKEPIQ